MIPNSRMPLNDAAVLEAEPAAPPPLRLLRRGPRDLVDRTAALESAARSYPLSVPIAFSGAERHELIATDGTRYLDLLTGAGVMLLGHNHPRVVAALEAARTPFLTSLDLVTAPKAAFLEAFQAILPQPLAGTAKVHFCGPTGSDSIEAALKLARIVTGRAGVFAFCGSYHGMGQGALSVTSNLRARRAGLRVRDEVTFLPFPYPFRSRVGDPEALVDRCLDHVRMLLEDDHSGVDQPGLMLIEAMQGEGGNIPAPARFLRGLRALCDAHGILLAFDEIQSGMGRTGRWFAFEHAGIRPDMICVSKGVGGGFPLALLVYDRQLDRWRPGDHIGTFRGQEFAFRAGRATIETIAEEGLLARATARGAQLAAALNACSGRPGFGEVRALGLFIGLECVAHGALGPGGVAQALQAAMLRERIVLERGGREGAVLRFLPPLTITPDEIARIGRALARAFDELPGD